MSNLEEVFEIYSIDELNELALQLVAEFKVGDVIALEADLGGGKTHFTKAMMQALGGDASQVTSPTFTLFQQYDLENVEFEAIYHWDWYRIESLNELESIGWHEYLEHDALHMIEWPSKFINLLNFPYYQINLSRNQSQGDTYRKVSLKKVNY